MQLLDLPNELLLSIFRYGGTDMLIGGPSESCRRLRDISDEPDLWMQCLLPEFRAQHLLKDQIDQIQDFRLWYYKQSSCNKRVLEAVDTIAQETRMATAEDIELFAWQILRYRFRAAPALNLSRQHPLSLAHFHWAFWLTEIMYRLEGVHLLLELSTQDNWGNDAVENPFKHIVAVYTLRNGQYPQHLVDAYQSREILDIHNAFPIPETKKRVYALSQYVMRLFATVSQHNDFLAVLGRGSLFMEIASRQFGWSTKLVKLPLGSYVSVEFPHKEEVVFVDFQRNGMLRSLQDVRERLSHLGAVGRVQYGISLYDILSTVYVWHTAPTTSRHCVLDLIEHAANEVDSAPLAQAPGVFMNLVRRIIRRNIAEVENAPLSRAVSSASLASMVGATSRGGWLKRGKVVQIPEVLADTHLGVVLEINDDSALVLFKSEQRWIIKQMLQPSDHTALISVCGLQVPDTGADMRILGQYFMNYNPQKEQFE